ncbi:MAG TPA: HD domain-containing protein [Candidatus Paceibacterota bacterium]
MPDVKDILSSIPSSRKEDIELITKAYAFAEKAHEGHTRFSGEPYTVHLFETAKGLAELGMGAETIAAGLLHDSIEDRKVSEEEVEKEFGDEILFLIRGVTKLGTLKYRGMERHTESLRKLFVATSQDIRVVIIKLMDRLHNMRTLQYVPIEKQKRIAQETLEIYVPIADRLGMGKIKQELEDLAFPYVYPKEYEETKQLLKQKNKEKDRLEKIHRTLQKGLAVRGITKFHTEYRLKGLYSLYRKYERKNRDIENIHDILALRIIVPTVADCYQVLGVVHSLWRPIPGEIKDYIAFPKPNGYQSLHTKILTGEDGGITEIQIRTTDMHRTAEYGIASHGLYKERQDKKSSEKGSYFQWVRQILPLLTRLPLLRNAKTETGEGAEVSVPRWLKEIAETQSEASGSEEFLENLKSDFFSHRVFVFTPRGDVIDLPMDASPIDFAYAVHSDIGDHMAGVKVNGKMVALDTMLHNGDIVEIVTKPSAHPSVKWVELAKTALARKHIRAVLEKEVQKLDRSQRIRKKPRVG